MTEISKMFKNANIKKIHKYQREIDNGDPRFTGIGHSDSYIVYPDFTAEKQLELIKWLAKTRPIHISFLIDKWVIEGFVRYGKRYDTFKDALSGYINHIWQDLTDQEKEEIRGILNEYTNL